MKLRAVAFALVALVAPAACSSTRHAATSPPTSARPAPASDYAALYTNAVEPADAAITTFDKQAGALTNTASIADLTRIAAPLASTLDQVDHRLLAIAWPATLATDMRAMVAADGAIVADLRNVPHQTAGSIPALKQRFSSDLATLTRKVATIVADLAPPTARA